MKQDFCNYLIGLSQAAAAALLASAVIIPDARTESFLGCVICSVFGAVMVYYKNKGG